MSTWQQSREITTRLVITGDLELLTPAHMGNGDAGDLVDMTLQRDALEGKPLLPGTSTAGALRAYLQSRQHGYRQPEIKQDHSNPAQILFGGTKGDAQGEQSPLIIDDALAEIGAIEIRDGVKIDPKTRTAEDKFKYDLELLPAGTVFPLRFELLISADAAMLESALATALHALEQGEIAIGARRSRGFGRCRVAGWRIARYDLTNTDDLLRWIATDPEAPLTGEVRPIRELLNLPTDTRDQRNAAHLEATFALASPLLIRAELPLHDDTGNPVTGDTQPDNIHLINAAGLPVLPGTSLAGALRARAQRILHCLDAAQDVEAKLQDLFGYAPEPGSKKQPTGSRVHVAETLITGSTSLVQNRVGIDRFTGGAYDTALFTEAPRVGGSVQIRISIIKPEPADVGLLLLLLKDLWTGDLPVGGTTSIGRGRLRGRRRPCTISSSSGIFTPTRHTAYRLTATGQHLTHMSAH